jgi:hypothetical protein
LVARIPVVAFILGSVEVAVVVAVKYPAEADVPKSEKPFTERVAQGELVPSPMKPFCIITKYVLVDDARAIIGLVLLVVIEYLESTEINPHGEDVPSPVLSMPVSAVLSTTVTLPL